MPGPDVCMGAMMMCPFGMAPSSLTVIRPNIVEPVMPAANIMDMAPMVNVAPFGMCMSLANPTVAAATAAALGVLTPMPCIPTIAGPWIPSKPTVLEGNMPTIDISCSAMCAFGGKISVVTPGQFKTVIT